MPENVCRVPLTGGNIRNNHFYLRSCSTLIPEGGVGGRNSSDPGVPFTVVFSPGQTIETDVDGAKMIFRARQPVRDFFKRSGAQEGDKVVIQRGGDRLMKVSLEPALPSPTA
ncbi:hypothetical protein GGQ97_001554 [Sphingomonas kaistensis]|uniref:Uncharacterized protein n=1 Tax=Sphingomonas kaistensis TaxID=298708 RepID=A0A7X5Y607_9SPHN|nr:hypothetical protein [Sphingomonas kaistensis]